MFEVLMQWRRCSCGSAGGVGSCQGDWGSEWQAVIADLFSGGAAWGDSPCAEAAFPAGIDAFGARGDFAEALRVPIDALDSQVAGSRAVDGEPEIRRNGGYDRYRVAAADENAWRRGRRPKAASWRARAASSSEEDNCVGGASQIHAGF